MAAFYYRQFQTVLIDADGVRTAADNESINVLNVTTGTPDTPLTSDDFGIVAEGTLNGNPGDVIEFSHATYPGTYRQTLADTQDNAYLMAENSEQTFILQNLFSPTNAATTADLIAEDLDDPNAKPFKIATVGIGVNRIPYQTNVFKNLKLSIVTKDSTGQQSVVDVSQAPSAQISIPGMNSPILLFEHYDVVTTISLAGQTLYSDTIEAGTWATDGDVLECEYGGYFAANANTKRIQFSVAGTQVADIAVTENNTKWNIEVEIMRVSNTTLRVLGTLAYGTAGSVSVINQDITSLDLDATDYDVIMEGRTPLAAGDLSVNMGFGQFWKVTGETILTSEDGVYDLADESLAMTITA